jgi:hypothetical protein
MGIGDEIMASGHAKHFYAEHGGERRVVICDARGHARWSGMWEGLPWILPPPYPPKEPFILLPNGARCRPYIDYKRGFTRNGGMNYKAGWRARDYLGHIQLNDAEMQFAAEVANKLGKFVIVEPFVPRSSNPNKQWGFEKWQALADLLRFEGMNPIQVGPFGLRIPLKGVPHIQTPTVRHGVAVMKFARWSFLPDGGLHHAAGVLGLPATVLWGGTNDPEVLGYPVHENIYFPATCGRWLPCNHCRTIWNWIKPAYVWARTQPRLEIHYGKNYRSC